MAAPHASELLDPEFASLVGAMPPLSLSLEALPALRAGLNQMAPELSDCVVRRDVVVPGEPTVRVRVHRTRDAEGLVPCIFSMHGGGYVLGRPEMDDALFDRWCPQLGVVGVSVEYRLAPDTPFPGPLQDCYTGLKWVHDHAEELRVDRTRIGIRGLSAGGGLAAAVALLARDLGELSIAFMLLEAPMLDDRRTTPSSQVDGLVIWSRESNEFGWRAYLGDLFGADGVPTHAAPARAEDLAGLPTTFVCVGALDGFRDEDVDFALRLNRAGVPTELHVYPGAPHGYNQLGIDADVCRRSSRDMEEWLSRQIRRPASK